MKKEGFTLIELLAVIVILAVIALIAVPIILNVIDTSKKGALKDSAYGIIDTAELYLAKNLENMNEEITFSCVGNKCTECIADENDINNCAVLTTDDKKVLNYKGTIDEGRITLYQNGKTSICIKNGEYAASKKIDEKEVTVNKGICDYTNNTIKENVSIDEYNNLLERYNELNTNGNAEAKDIYSGKEAIVKGKKITGTMPIIKAETIEISSGDSYTIPSGYHDGNGKVIVNKISSSYDLSKIKLTNSFTSSVTGEGHSDRSSGWVAGYDGYPTGIIPTSAIKSLTYTVSGGVVQIGYPMNSPISAKIEGIKIGENIYDELQSIPSTMSQVTQTFYPDDFLEYDFIRLYFNSPGNGRNSSGSYNYSGGTGVHWEYKIELK